MTVFHNLAYGDITLKRAISRPQRIVFLGNKEKGLYVGRPHHIAEETYIKSYLNLHMYT